ncbi:MAG: hypothetical protein R3E79_40295 [Caldilineaceae bacterium]
MVQKIRRFVGIIAVLGLLLQPGIFPTTAKATAAELEIWARWKLAFDFTGRDVAPKWTVAIGQTDLTTSPPTMQILTQSTQTIYCTPHNSFTVTMGEAIFDGNGYLECKLPSFYHTAAALAAGIGLAGELGERFMERCECTNPIPWVTADLTVAPHSESKNPLIHEINGAFDFAVPVARASSGAPTASSKLSLNREEIGPAYSWLVRENSNQIWSGLGAQSFLALDTPAWSTFLPKSFYAIAQSTTNHQFLQWENATPPLTFSTRSSLRMTNQETTFFIGYDGQDHFIGKLRKLAFDPGCTAE